MSNDLYLNFIFFDNYGISKTQKKMKRSDIMKFEELKELLMERKLAEVKKIYQEMNEYDIASLIEELPDELLVKAFRLLPKDKAVDVFVNLDEEVQRDLIAKLSKKEATLIIEDMFTDDAADLLEEMPAMVVTSLLGSVDKETRNDINKLLKYPEKQWQKTAQCEAVPAPVKAGRGRRSQTKSMTEQRMALLYCPFPLNSPVRKFPR